MKPADNVALYQNLENGNSGLYKRTAGRDFWFHRDLEEMDYDVEVTIFPEERAEIKIFVWCYFVLGGTKFI